MISLGIMSPQLQLCVGVNKSPFNMLAQRFLAEGKIH